MKRPRRVEDAVSIVHLAAHNSRPNVARREALADIGDGLAILKVALPKIIRGLLRLLWSAAC